MDVVNYASAAEWLRELEPRLAAAEAENNLLLGVAGLFVQDPAAVPDGLRLWGVVESGQPVGAAILSPRHNLVLDRQSVEALQSLATALAGEGVTLPGVVGPDEMPAQFANLWAARMGIVQRLSMRQRIYACSQVQPPPRAAGEFRLAIRHDLELLAGWWSAFAVAVGVPRGDDPEAVVRRIIAQENLFVWTHGGEIVSCAGVTRPTRNGIAVFFVYTPAEHRGHGFATSCVAALTERMLAAGRRFCCLYTDLSNPTSNAIYSRIGYLPICDSQMRTFEQR